MSDSLVAKRYASALYSVCLEQGTVDIVEKELIYFTGTLDINIDLSRLLLSPRISSFEKKNILTKLFRDDLSLVTLNFISLLVDKKRENLFITMADIFSQVVRENRNIVVARVTTAFPLSIFDQEKLREAISKITEKIVKLEIFEDPSLIGGLIVEVGDKVYDGSLTGHLKRIKQLMSEPSCSL